MYQDVSEGASVPRVLPHPPPRGAEEPRRTGFPAASTCYNTGMQQAPEGAGGHTKDEASPRPADRPIQEHPSDQKR